MAPPGSSLNCTGRNMSRRRSADIREVYLWTETRQLAPYELGKKKRLYLLSVYYSAPADLTERYRDMSFTDYTIVLQTK